MHFTLDGPCGLCNKMGLGDALSRPLNYRVFMIRLVKIGGLYMARAKAVKEKTIDELRAIQEQLRAKRKEINKQYNENEKQLKAAVDREKLRAEQEARAKEQAEAIEFFRACKSIPVRDKDGHKCTLYDDVMRDIEQYRIKQKQKKEQAKDKLKKAETVSQKSAVGNAVQDIIEASKELDALQNM